MIIMWLLELLLLRAEKWYFACELCHTILGHVMIMLGGVVHRILHSLLHQWVGITRNYYVERIIGINGLYMVLNENHFLLLR